MASKMVKEVSRIERDMGVWLGVEAGGAGMVALTV